MNIFEKLFGTSSQREVKAIMPIVDKIESLSSKYEDMEDGELQGQTDALRPGCRQGRPWTISFLTPLLSAARRPGGCWACIHTGCS